MVRKLLVFSLPIFLPLVLLATLNIGIQSMATIASSSRLPEAVGAPHMVPSKNSISVPTRKSAPPKVAKLKPKRIASLPLDRVKVTSKFGPRKHPVLKRRSFHNGVDMQAKLNDNVKSISPGVVTYSGARGALGNAVFVSHPKLKATSIYGHLNKVAVSKGQKISAGTVIGYAGTSGRSTGVHLHLTVKDQKTGTSIEPISFLSKIAGGDDKQADGAESISNRGTPRHGTTIVASVQKPGSVVRRITNYNRDKARRAVIAQTTRVKTSTRLSREQHSLVVAQLKPVSTKTGVVSGRIRATSPSNSDQANSANLQDAIAKAMRRAATMKQLYAEGIIARNKYMEAEARVNTLQNELQLLDSRS